MINIAIPFFISRWFLDLFEIPGIRVTSISPKSSDFIDKTFWIPAPRLRGDELAPAKAGAGITPLRKLGLTSFYVIPAEAEPPPTRCGESSTLKNQ